MDKITISAVIACLSVLWLSPVVTAKTIVVEEPEDKGVKLEEKDIAIRKELSGMVDRMLEHPEVSKKIVQTGKERTVFCNVCHGEDGISLRPWIPNLAGQSPVYLLDQFQRFADGRRYDRAMSSLSETFSEDEKVLLALYYAMMEVTPSAITEQEQWEHGKKVYEVACTQCHGENGRGEKGYARLAGQKPGYIEKMLKEFRDYTGRRFNPWMSKVTSALTDEEIANVAAYVSTLK